MMCPPGEYSDDGLVPCNKCPIGQYQSSHGQLECVECPVNHNTRNTGTQQMEDCLPLCPPGTYSSDRFEPCLECPCGTYSDMFGTMQCNNCSTIGAPQDQCTGIVSCQHVDLCVCRHSKYVWWCAYKQRSIIIMLFFDSSRLLW